MTSATWRASALAGASSRSRVKRGSQKRVILAVLSSSVRAGGSIFDPAEGARGLGHIQRGLPLDRETRGGIGIRNRPGEVAIAADAFPDRLDPPLPFRDPGIGRAAMFEE